MNISVYSMFCLDAETIMRSFARNNGIRYLDTARLCGYCKLDDVVPNSLEEWRKIATYLQRETATGESVVLYPHAAKCVTDSFKVLLWCNPEVSAKRMVDAKMADSVEDAVQEMKRQIELEQDAATGLWSGTCITDPTLYNLVLDCTYLPMVQIFRLLLDKRVSVYLDKRDLIPTKPFDPEYLNVQSSGRIPVHMHDLRWYVSSDHAYYAKQLWAGGSLLNCYIRRYITYHDKAHTYSYTDYEKALPPKEESEMITEESLQNVKAILFGNQKQANAINDAVVAIVAQFLDGHGADMSTQNRTAESIYMTLKEQADQGLSKENETFIQLVAGRKSYAVLKEGIPYIVSQNQPNVDSPKYNFRILEVGTEDVEDVVENGEREMYAGVKFERPAASPEEVLNPEDSLAEQARKLKDAILPMCPDAVKTEIGDEYAQALYCAQAYFEYNSR